MRIIIVLVLATVLFVTGSIQAKPQGPISIHVDRVPLPKILETVSAWAKVEFEIAAADTERVVSLNLDNPTLTQILDAIFLPIGLQYQIEGQRVIVGRR